MAFSKLMVSVTEKKRAIRTCFISIVLLFSTSTVCQARSEDAMESIEQIEAFILASSNERDFKKRCGNALIVNSAIEKLIQTDKLKAPADFGKAGAFVQEIQSDNLDAASVKYQLLLTAVSQNDKPSLKNLPGAWDVLIVATGRDPRIHRQPDSDSLTTAACVQKIFDAAEKDELKAVQDARDNAEVSKIVDADQKARSSGWVNLSDNELKAKMEADRNRLRRIKEIVAANGLSSASDFANAALVCQHGQKFDDYALAHELAVCALMLGDSESSWLCGASYDRMLLSASYPQRFCTQYSGRPTELKSYITTGMNDTMRVTVVGKTLQQALERARDFD